MTGKLWLGLGMLLVGGAVCAEVDGAGEKRGLTPNIPFVGKPQGLTPNIPSSLFAGAAAAVIAASPTQAADHYVLGRCKVARPGYGEMIRPTTDGGSYLFNYHGSDPRYKEELSSGSFFSGAKVTLIKAPAHGKVMREEGQWASETDYQYWPNDGYAGKDRFVMEIEKNGVKVRIQYLMQVPQEGESLRGWCNPEHWKISTLTDPTSPVSNGWQTTFTERRDRNKLAEKR